MVTRFVPLDNPPHRVLFCICSLTWRLLAIIIDKCSTIALRFYQHMIPLSERKQQILRALVEEYIHSATPVRKYGLNFSSATVRHELAGLEESNLIYQPHTSAGRVPTDPGYRYFVEHLMRESALSLD